MPQTISIKQSTEEVESLMEEMLKEHSEKDRKVRWEEAYKNGIIPETLMPYMTKNLQQSI